MKLNNQNREELPLRTHDEQSRLDYILYGDYYFPEVTLPEADKVSIGHYGLLRLTHLQKYRPGLYSRLILSGKLYPHLKEIDQACHKRLIAMVP